MATKKIKRFQEGGMSDKDRGLEASKDEKVGFFERLRMGNIDDEGSEAYRRFGAGRGKSLQSPAPVEDRAPTPVTQTAVLKPETESTPNRNKLYEKGLPSNLSGVSYVHSDPSRRESAYENMMNSEKIGAKTKDGKYDTYVPSDANRISSAQKSKPGGKKNVDVQASKPSAPAKSAPAKTSAYPMTGAQPTTKTYDRSGGPTADELANYKPPARNQSLASQIPGGSSTGPVSGKKVEPMSDTERNVQNMLAATGVGAGAAGALYKGKKMLDARKAAQAGAKKRANLKRDVEEGIERNLADEFQSLSSSAAAKKTAGGKKTSDYRSLAGSAREDAKANQAYDKLKKLSSRGAGKASSKKTKKFDDESNIEFKRGGSISGASKRADGIATKGKTRCKMR
jgi:hypothetical protein